MLESINLSRILDLQVISFNIQFNLGFKFIIRTWAIILYGEEWSPERIQKSRSGGVGVSDCFVGNLWQGRIKIWLILIRWIILKSPTIFIYFVGVNGLFRGWGL